MRPQNNAEILNHSIFKSKKAFQNRAQAALDRSEID